MKALCTLFLAGALGWYGWRHFTGPVEQPPGVLIAGEPHQVEVPAAEAAAIAHHDFQLKPLARYWINARVLHRRAYRYDRQAALSPLDLAVGWGSMSDSAVLAQLKISQSMRFYWYKYQMPPPIPHDDIKRQSANIHIIPADRQVEKFCKSLRTGELVHLEGELVEASGLGMRPWRSSLARDDTGNGACELLLVRRAKRLNAETAGAAAALATR